MKSNLTIFRNIQDIMPYEEPYKKEIFSIAVMNDLGQLQARVELDMALRLSMGNYTSYPDMNGHTVNIATSNGMALFNELQTRPDSAETTGNIMYKKLSPQSFEEALLRLPTADTLIITGDTKTRHHAFEILKDRPINLIVMPWLECDRLGAFDKKKSKNWFLADLSKSRAHYRVVLATKLQDDPSRKILRYELCVLSPFWIIGSFPNS